MADVIFTSNELRARDEMLADRLEREIREAAAQFQDPQPLQCRILVEMGFEPASSRIRIQFERPGWVKGFPPVSLQAPPGQVRHVAEGVLRSSLPPA